MSELLENIRKQPDVLATIVNYLSGEGREELERANAVLRSFSRVVFLAVGGSRYAAMASALYLSQSGVDARVLDASEFLYYEEMPADTAVVLVSRSGMTAETVRVAELLHGANIPYVAVTNDRESPMASMANVTVQVAGESDEGTSIRTYTGAVLTLLHLSAERVNKGKELYSESLAMLDLLREKMDDWEVLGASIEDARFFSFLGRGYSLSCACEASLLFHELARRPASWYSGAEFRQGPIEVLQPGDAVFVFAPDGPTRRLNAALVDELKLTGAKVIELGPPWPSFPEHLAAVTSIIPIQFAAFYLAIRNGDEPGNFRFASMTTKAE